MAEAEVAVIKRWFEEVWNQGREETIDELLAPDAPVYGVGHGADFVRGPDGFRPAYQQLKGAFPDIHFTIEDAVSERDMVALRWTATATHAGDGLGFAPTQKPVTITGMCFARVQNGKLVEGWNNWDMMGLMHEIGATPHAAVVRPASG
jgi:steroid delta-isomerase-like uncharacterized protein